MKVSDWGSSHPGARNYSIVKYCPGGLGSVSEAPSLLLVQVEGASLADVIGEGAEAHLEGVPLEDKLSAVSANTGARIRASGTLQGPKRLQVGMNEHAWHTAERSIHSISP